MERHERRWWEMSAGRRMQLSQAITEEVAPMLLIR